MSRVFYSGWIAFFFLSAPIDLCFAVQFTADMVENIWSLDHTIDHTRLSKLYVKDAKYRMEQKIGEDEYIVLVDQEANLTHVLTPSANTYFVIASDAGLSLMNDPFQAARSTRLYTEKIGMGKAKIAGYECGIYTFKYGEEEVMKLWVAEKFDLPLKMEFPGKNGRNMELLNIKEEPVKDDFFAIPAGYTETGGSRAPETLLPDWVAQISTAKIMSPPFAGVMSDGEMLRIRVELGKGIKVTATNNIASRSAFTTVPFKNGEPINDPSMYAQTLDNEGQSWGRAFKLTPYEADDIVIHVGGGNVMFNVELFDVGLIENVACGKEQRVTIDTKKDINFRLVNVADGESVCEITLAQYGEEVSDSIIGPKDYRTYTLKKNGESIESTWNNSAQADEFIVRVGKGEILVNVYQP